MAIRTINLNLSSLVDEVVANYGGSTVRAPFSSLAAQLSASGAVADRFASLEAETAVVRVFDTAKALLTDANVRISYPGGGGKFAVSAGDYIRAGAAIYRVLDAATTPYDVATVGGVRFDIVHLDGSPLSRGGTGDGITDDTAVINMLNVANTRVDLGGRDYA